MAYNRDSYRLHTPLKWQEIGQKLYRQKKYEDALQAFNAAVQSEHPDIVSVLDNRSATYEKLEKLDRALKDARQMIQFEKHKARGYLRTGKILIKKEKPELALQIYEKGLKVCGKDDPSYKVLYTQQRDLSSIYMTRSDFMETLPVELIHCIFSYLSFATLCKSTRVSKRWARFLSSQPSLWMQIDLPGTRAVKWSALSRYVDRAKGRLKFLRLGGIDLQGSNILYRILKCSPRLEDMAILTGGFLGPSQFDGLRHTSNLRRLHLGNRVCIDGTTVNHILDVNRGLEDVAFTYVQAEWSQMGPRFHLVTSEFPNLRAFKIKFSTKHDYASLPEVLPMAPNLETLSINVRGTGLWWDHRTHECLLRYKSLRDLNLGAVYSWPLGGSVTANPYYCLPPDLESLRIDMFKACNIDLDSNAPLPKLKTLHFLSVHQADYHYLLDARGNGISGLTEVELMGSLGITSFYSELFQAPRLLPLRRIRFHLAQGFGDSEAGQMTKSWTQLEIVVLHEAEITGVAVKLFLEGLPRLRQLVLETCTKVGGDAIDWARRRGIEVSVLAKHDCEFSACNR